MKKYILPAEGNFYKANLHCHTNLSDGALTVEEVKAIYKKAGYSIVAYSDHNVLIDHTDLNDENFLAMTSYEYNVNAKDHEIGAYNPCYHINFYPEDPHNDALPCYNPNQISSRHEDLRAAQKYVGTPDYVRDYNKVNEVLAEHAKHGFIAMLNHPTWSQQTMKDYATLDTTNIFAMEVYNHGCWVDGYDEINDHIYDELLRRGDKLFCTATDDNHNAYPAGTQDWDSLGGFVMIKAKELTHKAVFEALKAGNFYASMAPEIRELYVEDGKLHIETSPCEKIMIQSACRRTRVIYADSPNAALTKADIDLEKFAQAGYVRVIVLDNRGRRAWSQPIYLDDLK